MRQKNLKNILFLVVALQVLCISTAQATMTLDYIRYEYNSDNTAIYASGRSTTELYEIVLQHEIIYYDGKKYIVEGVGPAAFQQGKQRHVVLHKGMNYVKSLAFENSYQLKSITLPSTLTEIGDKAFANCPKLENVYAYYVTPPAVSGTAFSGSATNATLHVPKGTKIAYEEVAPWNGFASIVEDMDEQVITAEQPFEVYMAPFILCTAYKRFEIPVYLKNSRAVSDIELEIGFNRMSFDGQLPAVGTDTLSTCDSFATDGANYIVMSERAGDLQPSEGFVMVENENGASCNIKMNGTIEAGDGELFRLVMMPTKSGVFHNIPYPSLIVLTLADGGVKELKMPEITVIAQHLDGDMNDDGIVDVSDVNEVVNIMLGKH